MSLPPKIRYRFDQSGQAVRAGVGRGPVFIDIDGTLTDSPHKGGSGLPERIAVVEALIARGREVELWSACGTDYVRCFAKKYGLRPIACIGKPDKTVDDRPTIRPAGSMPMVSPEDFFDRP